MVVPGGSWVVQAGAMAQPVVLRGCHAPIVVIVVWVVKLPEAANVRTTMYCWVEFTISIIESAFLLQG